MSAPTKRLHSQLEVVYRGPSWHGPTLRELLADVTAEEAARHGVPNAHSIWEIVLHARAWKQVVIQRLNGTDASLQGEEDWPPVPNTSAGAWADAVRRLDAVNHELVERVGLLVDADLDRFVAGQDVSVYTTLHGVIQHDIYHAGQIALLKKALR